MKNRKNRIEKFIGKQRLSCKEQNIYIHNNIQNV